MEYTCLKSVGKGYVLTRKPEIIEKDLIISFSGAPVGATAVFENENGDSIYRQLSDNTCSVPADFLSGEIKVTIAVLNGKLNAEKYHCEPICAERVKGLLLVYPNWLDLPMQIIEILGFIQALKDDMSKLSNKYEILDEKVENLLAGYDFD